MKQKETNAKVQSREACKERCSEGIFIDARDKTPEEHGVQKHMRKCKYQMEQERETLKKDIDNLERMSVAEEYQEALVKKKTRLAETKSKIQHYRPVVGMPVVQRNIQYRSYTSKQEPSKYNLFGVADVDVLVEEVCLSLAQNTAMMSAVLCWRPLGERCGHSVGPP